MAIIAIDKVVVGIGLLLGSNKALDKVLGAKMIVFGITIRGNSKQYLTSFLPDLQRSSINHRRVVEH